MAYLNLAEMQGTSIAMPRDFAVTQPKTATGLTALEWQVVAIAQHDRLSTLEKPSRMSIALGVLFGGERPNPRLADPKLEALRRISVLAWHKGFRLPQYEIRAFQEAGYTADQLETLLASISRGRAALNQGTRHEHGYAH